MTVIQQMLENQISLLKQCLQFYADEKNWKINPKAEKSLVDADQGFLAQETLKNVQKLEEQNQQFSDQYDAIAQAQSSPDALMAEIQKMIDQTNK
jgi:hypothetical protein